MASRYETVRTDKVLGPGVTKLADDPGYAGRVLALCITADESCRIRFASGASPVATFYIWQGIPLVLPYNEEGWFLFPTGADINAEVTGVATIKVAVQAVWIREE